MKGNCPFTSFYRSRIYIFLLCMYLSMVGNLLHAILYWWPTPLQMKGFYINMVNCIWKMHYAPYDFFFLIDPLSLFSVFRPLIHQKLLTDKTTTLLPTLRAAVAVAATAEQHIPTPAETPAPVPLPPIGHRPRVYHSIHPSPRLQMEASPLVSPAPWNTS